MRKTKRLSVKEGIVWVCHEEKLTFVFLEEDDRNLYEVSGPFAEQLNQWLKENKTLQQPLVPTATISRSYCQQMGYSGGLCCANI